MKIPTRRKKETIRLKHLRKEDMNILYCWATNIEGKQKNPCIFRIETNTECQYNFWKTKSWRCPPNKTPMKIIEGISITMALLTSLAILRKIIKLKSLEYHKCNTTTYKINKDQQSAEFSFYQPPKSNIIQEPSTMKDTWTELLVLNDALAEVTNSSKYDKESDKEKQPQYQKQGNREKQTRNYRNQETLEKMDTLEDITRQLDELAKTREERQQE